jgi:hypothetical protein
MKENRLRKGKLWKSIAGVFLILILMVVAAAFYVNAKSKPMLSERIKEAVSNSSGKLYKLDFEDIHLNVITGTAVLDGVSLTPNLPVFKTLKERKRAPTHLFNIKLASLKLQGVGIYNTYSKKDLDINSILLDKPSINMIYNKVLKQADTVKIEHSLYEQMSKILKSIRVHNIRILNADFDYISGATGLILNSVKHLNVNINDFLLDSSSQHDPKRFYYTKDVSFELAGYESLTKDKMYTLKIDTIVGSATGHTVRVQGMKMIPMYPELAFSRKNKTQKIGTTFLLSI